MLKSQQPHTHTQKTDLPKVENRMIVFFWRIYQIIPLNSSFLELMDNVRGKGRNRGKDRTGSQEKGNRGGGELRARGRRRGKEEGGGKK